VSTDIETDGVVARVAQALWGQPLRVERMLRHAGGPARAVITGDEAGGRVLHLPPLDGAPRDHALAVAAHAAAHLRFGDAAQSRAGLKPVQQALRGVLEDARVEWLALQELPGLRAVWWPYHSGPAAPRGSGFEDLLARLSACLLNTAHHDPHPWIARAKALFFDAGGHTLALRSADDVRRAASVLGHDIGQMRLPFNATTYAVHATCRDDNSHLWLPDASLPPSDAVLALSTGPASAGEAPDAEAASAQAGEPEDAGTSPTAVHAEWDHRIRRYRADWCSVYTEPPPRALRLDSTGLQGPARRLAVRLAGLQGHLQRSGGRSAGGDALHHAALIDARLDQRAGRSTDPRIHRRQERPRPPLGVLLLLDASASTERDGALAHMQRAAVTAALALQRLGHRSAVWAFSSRGRHRVQMPCLKGWDDRLGHGAGLPAPQGQGSTRMGAALRHGLWLSAADARRHPGRQRVVVLLTDGELHDVDVHDPAYLPADLRRAGQEGARQGVAVRGLVFHPGTAQVLERALGRGQNTCLDGAEELPDALMRVLSDLAP
jgi:nitric oxide reductase NorD protein